MAGNQFLSVPSTATGLAPQSSSSAWSYGSWVEAVSSTTTRIYITALQIQVTYVPSVDTTIQLVIEVGTGAGGAESVKIQIPYSFRMDTAVGYYLTNVIYLPEGYEVATGTRVAVRATDSIASALTYSVKLFYREQMTMVVADATQSQTADNVTLTQHQILTVANATQAQTADNVTLTQHQVLTVANATQAQTADNVVLTAHLPTYSLIVDDATHVQTSDNVILTAHVPNYTLAVDDATQAQTSDEIILTAHNDIPPVTLFVDDCTQETRSDNIELTYHPEGEVTETDEGGWTDYTPLILGAYHEMDDEEALLLYAALEAIA
jgi:hypothetical protein